MGIKKVPFPYEHPRKRKVGTSSARADKPVAEETEVIPNKKKRKGSPMHSPLPTSPSKEAKTSETVLLRLVVKPPKAGLFPLFDEMIASGLSPKQAILGLLKRGFSQFESDVQSKTFDAVGAGFETGGDAIETTRSVDAAFVGACRDIFDKFELLTNRGLGEKIGEAIFSRTAKGR